MCRHFATFTACAFVFRIFTCFLFICVTMVYERTLFIHDLPVSVTESQINTLLIHGSAPIPEYILFHSTSLTLKDCLIVFSESQAVSNTESCLSNSEFLGNRLSVIAAKPEDESLIADLLQKKQIRTSESDTGTAEHEEEDLKTNPGVDLASLVKQLSLLSPEQITLLFKEADISTKIGSDSKVVDNPKTEEPHTVPKPNFQFSSPGVTQFNPAGIYGLPPVNMPGPTLRLPQFSGDGVKGEVSYKLWRYQVKSLIQDDCYPDAVIRRTIVQSLKGTAADVLVGINSLSTSGELLAQLDTIFGNILSKEELRAQFSATKQEEHENVVSWGCRLNQLLREIMDQGSFNVAEGTEMLRYHFWNGLKDEDLRNSIRYRYDNGQTYELLFKAARTVELEHQQRRKTSFKSKHTNVHQVSSNEQILSKLDKISDSMSAFDKRISDIEKLVTSSAVGNKQPQKQQQKRPIKRDMKLECERCHRKGHTIENCVAKRDASGKHLNGDAPLPNGGRQKVKP